MPILLSKRGWH